MTLFLKHFKIFTQEKNLLKKSFLFFILISFFSSLFFVSHIQAQYTIKGKITDAGNNDALLGGEVFVKGKKNFGAVTDFDGYYTISNLTAQELNDSITVLFSGYTSKTKAIKSLQKDKDPNTFLCNFQLDEENDKKEEVVLKIGEDKAFPIMRKLLANKDKNDKRKLPQYEYESYVKMELDIDNVTESFSKRKVIKQIKGAMDSLGGLTNEEGKPLIPLFISETISKFYYQKSPERKKEVVMKTKIEGVGFGDDSPITQILGASFQEYNFYQNWMSVLGKDFVSPLADSWKAHYNYYLVDSMASISGKRCYLIEVEPRRKADLAFTGNIWVDYETYALRQIDVAISKEANINFIEKLKIQQELSPTEAGAWMPIKTRVLVDIAELTNKSAGILAKFYVSNKNIDLKKTYPIKFYRDAIEMDVNAKNYDKDYWVGARHDSLTASEIRTYALIDTIKQVPLVKTYTEIIKVLSSGYKTIGKIDFGNYAFTYAFNDIEGHRFRFGMRTNDKFSKWFEFSGYGAYGIADKRFKYNGQMRFLPSRKIWTEITVGRNEDIVQIANNQDALASSGVFLASLNFFNVSTRSPFFRKENFFAVQTDFFKGFTQVVKFRQREYQQIGQHFAYFPQENVINSLKDDFNTTEIIFETRLAKQETFYYAGNYRRSLGTAKLPIMTFRYTMGIKGFMGGDFHYDKFSLAFDQSLNLGSLGRTNYSLTSSYTPSKLPYPLLEVHVGNRGIFYNFFGYGLMNFLEFASDRHVSLNMEHNFKGLVFNSLPYIRKWKLRSFVAANILWGSLRDENRNLVPLQDQFGNSVAQPKGLGETPYIELGYGISNIFKFFRVTFLHRTTYLDQPNIRKFGVFFSARFDL